MSHFRLIGAAKYLSHADNILILSQKGSAEFYGPPQHWKDYQEFIVQNNGSNSSDSVLAPSKAKRSEDGSSNTASGASTEDDSQRQQGDLTDWVYYAKFIGPLPIFALALFTIITTACMQFPSESMALR
jgi:hypothetical protein